MDWRMFITFLTDIAVILGILTVVVPPIRKRVFGQEAIKEGQKCLLRSKITDMYYANRNSQNLRVYEYENLCSCYQAYKALGGNSYVKKLYDEMQDWKVTH